MHSFFNDQDYKILDTLYFVINTLKISESTQQKTINIFASYEPSYFTNALMIKQISTSSGTVSNFNADIPYFYAERSQGDCGDIYESNSKLKWYTLWYLKFMDFGTDYYIGCFSIQYNTVTHAIDQKSEEVKYAIYPKNILQYQIKDIITAQFSRDSENVMHLYVIFQEKFFQFKKLISEYKSFDTENKFRSVTICKNGVDFNIRKIDDQIFYSCAELSDDGKKTYKIALFKIPAKSITKGIQCNIGIINPVASIQTSETFKDNDYFSFFIFNFVKDNSEISQINFIIPHEMYFFRQYLTRDKYQVMYDFNYD